MAIHVVVMIVECFGLTLTLEKYDRIIWRLHTLSEGYRPTGSVMGSFEDPFAFQQRLAQEAENEHEERLHENAGTYSSSGNDQDRQPGRGMLYHGFELHIRGFAAQYSNDVLYFIEVEAPG